MLKKPVIGLTSTRFMVEGQVLSGLVKDSISQDYSDAIEKCGGIPIIMPSTHESSTLERYFELCDGFIVTGGKDVHPLLYNEAPTEQCGAFDHEVDVLQVALIKQAVKTNKPILGICRGAQLLNVALGGNLYQDINSQVENSNGHRFTFIKSDTVHEITLQAETKLSSLFGNNIYVNSIHHQAINKLGKGLIVSAQSNDGIIEGIELPSHKFAIGVQWHPEMMLTKSDTMKCLFDDLIYHSKTGHK